MKKWITMLIILMASVVKTSANDEPKYHRFYNPGFYASNPSEAEARAAFKTLFSGNDAEAAKYWNPAVSFAAMRDIYALHAREVFGHGKDLTDQELSKMVDLSTVVMAPPSFEAQFETSGILKGTTQQVYYQREITPGGEILFAIEGIVWASGRCGNPTRLKFSPNKPVNNPPSNEGFDKPSPQKGIMHMASHRDDGRPYENNRGGNINNTINMTSATSPGNGNSGGGNNDNSGLLMALLMQNMNRQPVERQQSTFLPTLLGSLLGSGVGTFAGNALGHRNQRGYSQVYRSIPPLDRYTPPIYREEYREQPEYRYPPERPIYRYPREPDYNYPPRQPREYDPGIWPERRYDPDYQGGSGNYGLNGSGGYQNANAGLGVGQNYGSGYNNDPYYNQRNNPLRDDGRGNAEDLRNGRRYTYDTRRVY